ncbi:hypothetical protein [Nocardioides terrisoli]|uniref:hypothetical protein n=1 Tax=Nocardioides terrisoli TaxID=3388267 RepID=UPI00287B6EA0|nr:hypothetical protein [Nocardioides marmorisolisilvae]
MERTLGWVSRWPWYVVPLVIFLLSRVVDTAILLHLAPTQDPALLEVRLVPTLVDPPTYLHVIQNWDGQWYRNIAEHGYPTTLPTLRGLTVENQWAFYPLYPALVALVMLTGASFGVGASVVSLACGAGAVCVLDRMLTRTAGRFAAVLGVLALCMCPTGLLFQAAYTESLALLLILAALWCLQQRRYGAVLALGLLLSVARPVVFVLALVVVVHGVVRYRAARRGEDTFSGREQIRVAALAGAVAASFGLWPLAAGLVTGNPAAYFLTRGAWSRHSSAHWSSRLGQALTFASTSDVLVTFGVLALVAFLVWRRGARRWGPELRTWVLAYPVYVFAATRPTTSLLRYLMLTVAWWPFPDVAVSSRRVRVALCVLVFAVGAVLQYFWMHWYYIIAPGYHGYP